MAPRGANLRGTCHTPRDVSENGRTTKLSAAQRRARTVQPQKASKEARQETVKRATSRVSGQAPINFVRAVRGE